MKKKILGLALCVFALAMSTSALASIDQIHNNGDRTHIFNTDKNVYVYARLLTSQELERAITRYGDDERNSGRMNILSSLVEDIKVYEMHSRFSRCKKHIGLFEIRDWEPNQYMDYCYLPYSTYEFN